MTTLSFPHQFDNAEVFIKLVPSEACAGRRNADIMSLLSGCHPHFWEQSQRKSQRAPVF
jgi:hypothetical protein